MLRRIRMKLLLAAQKHYGANKIKYIFERHKNSNCLIVVFSGFSPPDEPARYNYMRALDPLKVNKLFVLDDFGYKNRGSYYLTGRTRDDNLQAEICELIEKYKGEKKLITAGSSKGGSAALLYGLKCGADTIISGAPQYYIGSYLASDNHRAILTGICGDDSEESVLQLNRLLPDLIRNANSRRTAMYIHCSSLEHTYEEHVKDLLEDLRRQGFAVYEDLDTRYSEHSVVGRYFSEYLFRVVQKISESTKEL